MNDDTTPTRRVDPDDYETRVGLAAGRRIFGRYTLEAVAGRGGMGVVWRARDEELGETVALKLLPEAVARDTVAVDELKEETRKARRLRHPHIVSVFDFVRDGAMAAVSMEFVDGATLAHLRLEQPGKVFAPEKLAPLVAQLCAALNYAHTDAKVVHRDLKPANLLVTREGRLKVTDFGIARSLSETSTRLTGSVTGGTSGTLLYMSPQQLLGKKATAADDIYALGATLYELLTGKPPFFTGDITHQILNVTPAGLAAQRAELGAEGPPIPREWEETILACLAKEPRDRPQSAGEVAARLGLAPPSSAAANPDLTAAGGRWRARRATLRDKLATHDVAKLRHYPLAALGAVAALAALAWIFWPARPPVKPATPAQPSAKTPNSKPETPNSSAPAPASVALPREFVVTVDPPDAGARLWLGPQSDLAVPADGRALVKDLPDGEHELLVQAPGYQPLTTRVTVKDGRGNAEARLVLVKGVLEITARPGTVVTAIDATGAAERLGTVGANGRLAVTDLLRIGRYTVKLEHPDCTPVAVDGVELTPGKSAVLAPAQVPLPGELRIFSVPTGAEVSVNGKSLGTTPATLREQPSETALAVEVFARGYRRSTQTVTLKPKEVRTVNLGTLAAESGGIDFRFVTAGLRWEQAKVLIDGKEMTGAASPTPAFEGLEVGARAVEITHPDYESWKQTVTVRDQQMTAVEVKLVPKPGRLAIRAEPREITLTVNGRAVHAEEIRNGELTLPAGELLTLVAIAKGCKSATRTLTLPANGSDTWEVTLKKLRRPKEGQARTIPELKKLRGPEEGQAWTIPELNLKLKFIAPGTFTMGEDSAAHQVTLTQGYWLGKTEVTQAQWQAVMGNNPSNFKGDDLPVESVSWEEAMAFCQKLTEREQAAGRLPEGYAYTLPTEAQWEYACRAGTTGAYAVSLTAHFLDRVLDALGDKTTGDEAISLTAMAWYNQNSGNTTHAVGAKRANAWGLYDMHGNVCEWCENGYFRGGSWFSEAADCRSAFRLNGRPDYRNFNLGFRLALSSVR